jgi:hypothetical protein
MSHGSAVAALSSTHVARIKKGFVLMKLKLAAALFAATMLSAAPAHAALLQFQIEGTVPNKFTASFVLDTTRAPSIVNANTSVRYNGVPINYTLPGETTPRFDNGPFDGPTFFTTSGGNQGGLSLVRLDAAGNFGNGIFLFGPQLFQGTTAAPQFSTGTFLLSDISRSLSTDPLQVNYRVTISNAVPEPATWAMIIGGFGLIGGTMRRRKVSVRFA